AFTQFDGRPATYLVRLNADGTRDLGFAPAAINNELRGLAVQPDGRIVVGGRFTGVGGAGRGRVARLNADGSLDATFDPGSGANDGVRALVLQPDGRVLIAGQFTSVNGTPRNRIARLNADGSLDPTFDPGTGADAQVRTLALQSDGRVLAGGEFTNFN